MIRILAASYDTLPMRTRLPFRYGIVTLREIEHCVLRVTAVIDGVECTGMAADGLAPKWFTKDPAASIEEDVAGMKRVIATACDVVQTCGEAETVFALWQHAHAETMLRLVDLPSLLANFGISLVERALIDAYCRVKGVSFAHALRTNAFGIWLDALHPELAGYSPVDLLPAQPLRRITARHTVGFIDPLVPEPAGAPSSDLPDDGLPVSLQDCIQTYGLTHFKIKLCGNLEKDLARLNAVAAVIKANARDFVFTVDGNEQYGTVEQFKADWQAIAGEKSLTEFMRHLLFVEQPLHRDVALHGATAEALLAWRERPRMIIDESDGDLHSLRQALAAGYAGTSHKNCKGVFKGIANACLVALRERATPHSALLSGEDLANVGPVALLQDLAVMASLGIAHVERNGHHYFRGLSMFPLALQTNMLNQHGDLFEKNAAGLATLVLRGGALDVTSIVDAPFGYHDGIDLTEFFETQEVTNL